MKTQQLNITAEKFWDIFIENWKEVVTSFKKLPTNSIPIKRIATMVGPGKKHVYEIIKNKCEISKTDCDELITKLCDYEKLLTDNGHLQLGKVGVSKFLEFEKKNDPTLNATEILDQIEKKSRVFTRTPEELKSQLVSSSSKKNINKKTRRDKKEEEEKGKVRVNKPILNLDITNKKTVEPPKIEPPKTESESKIKYSKNKSTPTNIERPRNQYRKINEEHTSADPVENKKVIKNKTEEQKLELSDLADTPSRSENFTADQILHLKFEVKNELLNEFQKNKIDDFSINNKDEDFAKILKICYQIKVKFNKQPFTVKNILEEAVKIDENFANMFFMRFFPFCPLPELLNMKPTTFISL